MDKHQRLREIRKESKDKNIPVMREESFKLLQMTVRLSQPRTILEIGTATGCSGIAMLLASKNDSKLTTIELDEKSVETARANFIEFEVYDRVNQFIGDASEIIPKISGKFDFIFLDGPKGHYLEFLPYLKELLNEGGVLFSDNVLFQGYIMSTEETPKKYKTIIRTLREFIEVLTSDEDFVTEIIDIEDGVSISQKRRI